MTAQVVRYMYLISGDTSPFMSAAIQAPLCQRRYKPLYMYVSGDTSPFMSVVIACSMWPRLWSG